MAEKIRLAVVVADFGAAAHVPGADVQREVRTFDLPAEIESFIRQYRTQWSTVSLAIEVTAENRGVK